MLLLIRRRLLYHGAEEVSAPILNCRVQHRSRRHCTRQEAHLYRYCVMIACSLGVKAYRFLLLVLFVPAYLRPYRPANMLYAGLLLLNLVSCNLVQQAFTSAYFISLKQKYTCSSRIASAATAVVRKILQVFAAINKRYQDQVKPEDFSPFFS